MVENLLDTPVSCGAWQTKAHYDFAPKQKGLIDSRDVRELLAMNNGGTFRKVV
jgi:hypothetical protein